MPRALFSIKPEYVERVFSKEKRFEFRTIACKKQISKIIIYETSPVSKIVGEVSVLKILKDSPEKLWEQTKEFAGTDFESYSKYFFNRKVAYAYFLENPIKYENPKLLKDYNIFVAPQSFMYLEETKAGVAGGV